MMDEKKYIGEPVSLEILIVKKSEQTKTTMIS